MGPKYETNVQELGAAVFKDAEKAADVVLDVVDARVQSGKLEPLEDAVTDSLKSYAEGAFAELQERAGVYGKFAGDVFDDAEGAVDFLLSLAQARVASGRLAPLVAGASALLRPTLVDLLEAKQAALAGVKIEAED